MLVLFVIRLMLTKRFELDSVVGIAQIAFFSFVSLLKATSKFKLVSQAKSNFSIN